MGFDVASNNEIKICAELGVKPENLIFANPMKTEQQLKYAKKMKVSQMTFDNEEELHKIKAHFPKADCMLRIETESTSAVYNLNEKFGAQLSSVPTLLKLAKKLNLRVKGVAFHTGSGGVQFSSYESSLHEARKIFDMAAGMGMKEMDLVDIGGGFTLITPNSKKNFEEVAPSIGALIDKLFPEEHVRFIAEPGRYIAECVCYLACKIIGQKTTDGHRHFYINNGIYQGYMVRQFGEDMEFHPLDDACKKRKMVNSTWWGQTCDSCDWVVKKKDYPDYKTGEWVVTDNHGAYHKDLSCTFNGFELPNDYYYY